MADQLNTGQIVTKPELVIDTLFPTPPGVIGVRQNTAEDVSEGVGDEVIDGDVESDTDEVQGLIPPNYIYVIGSTSRFSGGRSVVDVLIEIEDVPGAQDYDVQYSIQGSNVVQTL